MFWWHSSAFIFWGAIAVIAVASSYFRYREGESRNRMLQTLAEKGQPISPELLSHMPRHYYRRYYNGVQSGIFLMCVGIALAVFFWAMGGGGAVFEDGRMPNWLPVIGIFPFMVGVARLLGGLAGRRDHDPDK
jgi:dolichol kinase